MTAPPLLRLVRRAFPIPVAVLAMMISVSAPGGAETGRPPKATVVLHGVLKSSVPKDKSRLPAAPKELRLTFTEAPEMAVTRIMLRAPGGREIALGTFSATGAGKATVVAPITGAMTAGTYTVEWEIAGEDGHPVVGTFTFTVIAEAVAPVSPAAQVPAPPAMDSAMTHHDTVSMPRSATRFDAESGGYVLVRFFLYTALLIVVGSVAFRSVVLSLVQRRPGVEAAFVADAARRAAFVGWMAAWLLLAACIARFFAQSLAMNGADEMMNSSRVSAIMVGTKWGLSWLAQLSATLVALYGFNLARLMGAGPARVRAGWSIAGIAALVLAFTPAFASHAAASQTLRSVAMLFDGLHIIGASGWMGSLFLVLAAGIPAALALRDERRGPAVADLINAFSPTALMFTAMLAGTGLFAAWLHLGSISALWGSDYGNWLFRKLVVLSVVAATGAYNWLRVKPSLGTIDGAGRIRRSATVEVTVAVIVLIITAILVATPPPMRTV